jgi:hypothetical protein
MKTENIPIKQCPFCHGDLRHRQWFGDRNEEDCYSCRWWKEEGLSKYSVFFAGDTMTACFFFVEDICVQIHFDEGCISIKDYHLATMPELDRFDIFVFSSIEEIIEFVVKNVRGLKSFEGTK